MTALQSREDYQQLAFPGTVSRVGMELEPGLSKQEWLEAGRRCALLERANRWWIGDFLNYGEHEFGDTYTEGMLLFELPYGTLRNLKSLAAAFGLSRRRDKLSWSHHSEVAPLDDDVREYWLDCAEANGWTRQELRAWIKAAKAKPLPTHTPLLRFCQNLPTPVIIAQILRVYFSSAETALDMTGGNGGFWDGSELLEVTRLVVDPTRSAGELEDFRSLPHIADEAHDVAIFDPPHLAETGESGAIMGGRFGDFDNMAELEQAIRDGCHEAWRIGRLGAVIKVTDHVHGQRYVLESDWVRDAIGTPPFDEVYQVRPHAMIDPKWEEQLSAYNNGSTYLIFRKDGPVHKRQTGRPRDGKRNRTN